MEKDKKIKLYFLISIVLVVFSGLMAYGFQTNFGTIDVQEVAITHTDGTKMVGKLYRPVGVDNAHPAPGILAIHGYNNDKDVQRGTSLELARAGFVVLAIDQIGHGDSEGALDAAFSTQILGASTAYVWLARQAFVDGGMGVIGHSMGYISAFYFPLYGLPADVYAPNASIFETFPPSLQNFFVHKNVLHIWSEYEEWYTVDMTLVGPNNITSGMTVSQIYEQGLIVAGMNAGLAPGTPAEVDHTYGDFSTGNAYREHYVRGTTHPGQTMDMGVNQEAVAWMLQALKGESEAQALETVGTLGQTYLYTEIFSGAALFISLISVMFLAQILLSTKYFEKVKQPMPERVVTKKKLNWWVFASINTGIAAVVFILFTNAGNAWDFSTNTPILSMGMINNWLGFFLMTAAIAIFFIGLWYHLFNKKERGSITPYDLGVSYGSEEVNMDYMQGKKYNWGKLIFFLGLIVLVFPIVSQIFSAFDNYFAGWGDWLLIPWWGLWLIIGSILVILGIVMLFTKLKEKKLWKTLGVLFLLVGAFFDWMTMHILGFLWWAYWLYIPAFAVLFVGVLLLTNLKKKRHWGIFGKTVLLAGVLFGWMYLLVSIFQGGFLIEFRIFWAFAKLFTLERFVLFLIYLPMFLPFFLVNGGILLFGQLRQEEAGSSFKTYFIWWIKLMFATLAGLLVVFLVQYLGVMVSNYPFEGYPNAPIMYLQLMSAIPLFGLLYFIMIFFFRKTGKIYLGSFFGAIVCVWFLTVGTLIGAAL
ncbi:MAG: hypothetical protein EAX91_11520 [Candidatus Lokiarchaeota archaeon]|nr:hypothetical protein [Candidatus Lokiarchaeota archaeon]